MSGRLVQERADVQGLSTAILVPSVDLLGSTARTAMGPLTPVVGVGLFHRAVLTLQHAGIRQLIILAGPEEEQLKQALTRGPRVTIPVRWMPIREFPLDDVRTWDAVGAEVQGFCLLAGVGGVFSRPLIERLRRDVQEGEAVVVARRAYGISQSRFSVETGGQTLGNLVDELADLVVVPCSLLQAAGREVVEPGFIPVRRWLEHAIKAGRLRVLPTDVTSASWYQAVRSPDDLRAAERRLFASLKGEYEGFVDRYVNRRLSRWFTQLFLRVGLSPNAITIVATLIGFVAAALFGMGSYAAGIAAALLFQLAAVVDCCDGEVARLTFTESPFGAWLDIAMDNVVHMAVFAGIATGAYMRLVGDAHAWVPLALGALAIFGNAASFMLVIKAQKIHTVNRWKTPVHAAWSEFILRNVASRDFTVVVLLFALWGKLEFFLWLAAAGSILFTVAMIWVLRPCALSRA
jgi:phosphatidylglycerophosphate synthase